MKKFTNWPTYFYCLKVKAVLLKYTSQNMGWWYTNIAIHFGCEVTHMRIFNYNDIL